MAEKISLAEQSLMGRSFETCLTPYAIYCFKCNIIMQKDTLAKRYDAATFTHEACPSIPLVNVAIHKY